MHPLYEESANSFCKGPNSAYCRLCRQYVVSIMCFLFLFFFKQSFKNVKPILSLQAVQKQATGQIWQIDQSLWTPALYHCQINPPEMQLWSYHFLVGHLC